MPVRHWLPGLPSPSGFLVFLALLVALGPGLPRMFASDGDVGRHIRVGAGILSEHEIPNTDSLSHTRYGKEWVPVEWLSQITLARVEQSRGLSGVATIAAILFAVAVAMTYVNATVLGGTLRVALGIATISMLLQIVHLLPRPHLTTTALASVLLFLLIQYRRTADLRWVLAVPLMFIIWTNSHGGFPAGLALLTLFVADIWLVGKDPTIRRQRWTLTTVLVLSVAATLINPVGPALWSYVFGHLFGNSFLIDVTQEFQSPDFHAPWGKLLLMVIVGVALLLRSEGKRLPLLGLAILLGTLAATLVSARHITLFATLGLPWLASPHQPSPSRTNEPSPRRSRWPSHPLALRDPEIMAATSQVIPLIAIGILILATNGPFAARARFDPTRFPVQALNTLGRSERTGAVFNEMEWGGYLLYTHPDIPVFIDGRTDFYGEELAHEYFIAHQGAEGWSDVLDRYRVQWTLTRRGTPLNQLLALSDDWRLVVDDGVTVTYRRAVGIPPDTARNTPATPGT